jgi:hypothetical protein
VFQAQGYINDKRKEKQAKLELAMNKIMNEIFSAKN